MIAPSIAIGFGIWLFSLQSSFASDYRFEVIASSKQGQFANGFIPTASINDDGRVAFTSYGPGFTTKFLYFYNNGSLSNVTSGRITSLVQLNNQSRITSSWFSSGGSIVKSFIRVWDSVGSFVDYDQGGVVNGNFLPLDVVYAPSINNVGTVAYVGAANNNTGQWTYLYSTKTVVELAKLRGNALALRPMIADDNTVVVRVGDLASDPIVIYAVSGQTYASNTVASLQLGFTTLGAMPSISDDGRYVAFYGDLSTTGINAITARQPNAPKLTPGKGIFLYDVPFKTIYRITGTMGDRRLDPGETFEDTNRNGLFDPGENELNGFNGFSADSRIGINATGVVFLGTLASESGIYLVNIDPKIVLPPPNGAFLAPESFKAPVPVLSMRHKIFQDGSASETNSLPVVLEGFTSFALHDPLNIKGEIAFYFTTASAEGFLKAVPTIPLELQVKKVDWNEQEKGIDVVVSYTGPISPIQTDLALFWCKGPGFADRIAPAFYSQAVSLISGQEATIHIAAAVIDKPHEQTVALLAQLDPSAKISESNRENNSRVLGPCPVKSMETDHFADASSSESKLETNLQAAVQKFRAAVTKIKGASFSVTSTYRSLPYQSHLYEIRSRYKDLRKITGMKAFVKTGAGFGLKGRPQLEAAPGTPSIICRAIMDKVNKEILDHTLIPNKTDQGPAVNPPGDSLHASSPSRAVDISIGKLSDAKKVKLAKEAGLIRPNPGDFVHYKLASTNPQNSDRENHLLAQPPFDSTLTVQIFAPQGLNLLVADESGKRIGFEPISQTEINEFGPLAEYSGTNSEPNVVVLPQSLINGGLTVSAKAFRAGKFTIEMEVSGEDAENPFSQSVLSHGDAGSGQVILPAKPYDVLSQTYRLEWTTESDQPMIFWPAWATNRILQISHDLRIPSWSAAAGADYVDNQLIVTNFSGRQRFFRLANP